MKYVNPHYLLLIPVFGVLAAALMLRAERRKRGLLRLILGARAADPRAVHLSPARRRWKQILLVTAMLLLLAAAARPYRHTVPRPAAGKGRDVLVLFDVSKSMRAADLPPDRLAQAKYLLNEVISAHSGDRFGIVPFAGNAFLSCPLTADRTALKEAAADLDVDSVPLGGTNLEAALRTAARAFAGAEGDHRAILLFTDGDALTGDPAAALKQLREQRIPVAVAGFGDPALEAPVPDGRGGVMRDRDGKPAASRLNEAALREIAAATGGVYVRSRAADTGAGELNRWLDRLGTADFGQASRPQVDDLFPGFIAAAFALLVIAALLPERRAVKAALLLATALTGLTLSAAGDKVLEPPADPYEAYAQGRRHQLAGDAGAAAYYEQAVQAPAATAPLRAAALQNLGVLSHTEGRELLTRGRAKLREQQPDEALKQVETAERQFAAAAELYARSMEFSGPPGKRDSGGANYRQLLLDRQKAEQLKKELEELKKRQQQARQQTQSAQQQNQQDQQNRQDQSGRQNQPNRQDQSGRREQATRRAEQAARDLAEQAGKLNQKELEKQAKQAAEDLAEARRRQERNDSAGAQEKLDAAARELGRPDKPETPDQPAAAPPQAAAGKGDKPPKAAAAPGRSAEDKAAEHQLDRLDDEAAALREAVRRRRNLRRAPVEKDW